MFIIILTLSLSACGTTQEPVGNTGNGNSNGDITEIMEGKMETKLIEVKPNVYQYILKNQTEKEITLEFSSSQRYDYTLTTKNGEEVYRFSSLTSFLQVLGEETLKQGEELTYDIDLSEIGVEAGDYVLTVWLTPSTGVTGKVTKDITIPENLSEHADGIFKGQIDPHTIEVEIDGVNKAFELGELQSIDFSHLTINQTVTIKYTVNQLGQNLLEELLIPEQ
jgi:hypothetical protein